MNLTYKVGTASREQIREHFQVCDRNFAPPLSSRVDLDAYADKLFEKAASFEAWDGDLLVGMINAYLNDTSNGTGFITNVSVLQEYMGGEVASRLLQTCLEHAARLGFGRISLEVAQNNGPAIKLYSKAGFKAVKETGEYLLMERQAAGQGAQGVVKSSLDHLAILGGTPGFAAPLHVGRPNVGDRAVLLARINDLLDRRWLTNRGPFVHEFEGRVADLLGTKHCIAMCNGTVALEIAIRALGLQGEVIVPSFTFVATAHALQWQEITPVFCDVDPVSHNLDPKKVEALITPRTTGIIGVHVWGRPCAVEALQEIAQRRGLRLMFDAAHAFGNSHKGRMIGNFGQAEVFSFHATKFFNTFEGGAVVTNDDELASKIRLMKNFGFAGYDNVIYIGTNGKMSEISAAMGLTGLESLDEVVAANRCNYQAYRARLQDLPGIRLIDYDEGERCNYQYVIVEVDEAVAGTSRDQLVEILHAENILARRYFYPGCHQMEPYRSYFPHAGLLLPETERLTQRVMSLPTGTAIGPKEIAVICAILRLAVGDSRELATRLVAVQERLQP